MFLRREWTKEQKRFNEVRRVSGLEPLDFKKKKCLKCDKTFLSESPSNRLCLPCKVQTRGLR